MNNTATKTDVHQINETLYLADVHAKADKIIDKFVIFFFLFGLVIAPIYSTWLFSLGVGSLTLLMYGIAKFLVKNKFYARMITSVVLAMFVLQYIGQMHGMAELHFFFFTNIALLILYQDWRVILPYTLVTVLHHTVLAFLQWHLDMNELAQYFISYTDITFLQMGFHFGIVSLMAYIAILWAVMLKNNSMKLFAMQAESKEQNEKLQVSETKLQAALANTEKEVEKKTEHLQTKTEELLAAEEELRQNLEEITTTQELLQQSNLSLESKMIAINKTVGYMELGMDRKILTINEKLAEWLEYSPQELEGQVHLEVVEPNYAQSNEYEHFWQQMGEGKVFSEEFLRITKTGKRIWVYASYCPTKDESGRVIKIVKLAVNITEQKEKAQELLASEEELRQNLEELQTTQESLLEALDNARLLEILMNNSSDAFQAAEDNGKLIYMNQVGLSRLGLTKEQMLNMYVRDFEKAFTEDGTWEAHVADMKALKSLTIQSVNHDKTNNRDFPVEVSIRHVEIGDKGYLMATSRDVTERRKAEAEIQAQNEELQASQEELRQNLEELQATQEILAAQKVMIEEKEINLRALIDNTKDSIFSLDTSYCFITANKTVIQQYAAAGVKIEKGVCVLDLAPSEEVRILFKALYDRALGGEDVKMEQDYSDVKNGIIAIFELLISPMKNTNGNIIGCSVAARDITERKQAEAEIKQLSLVASKTNSAIVITDNKGLVTWVNDAFVEISGYTVAEVLGKKPGAMLQGKDTNPAHIQKIREGLASKKPFVQEILNYHRNGTPYWLSLSITPIFDETGELVQFIGVETDITDVKKQKEVVENALQELKAAQNQLIQSEKMASLGQLVASIAHEVNTPLGAIRSSATNISGNLKETLIHIPLFINNLTDTQNQFFVELLEKTPEKNSLLTAKEERKIRREIENLLDENQVQNAQDLADLFTDIGIYEGLENYTTFLQEPKSKETVQMAYKVSGISRSVDTILTATERASKVIFALKNFARHDHSGQKQKTSFNDNIETVLIIYTNQLKQGIEVVRHYTDLPEILCYPDELMQVWTNIIHNAIQAMNNKGVLTISTKIVGNNLLTSIEDTGGGIPLDIQDKIFNAFFTTKKAGEGTGLGLDIVKKIVAKHEGNIWFESKVGQGTTFFVEIPIVVE